MSLSERVVVTSIVFNKQFLFVILNYVMINENEWTKNLNSSSQMFVLINFFNLRMSLDI